MIDAIYTDVDELVITNYECSAALLERHTSNHLLNCARIRLVDNA
jgi:hypothetical protein